MAIDPTPRAIEFRIAASYRRGARTVLFALIALFLAGQAETWLWGADGASLGKTVLAFSILVGPGVILVLFATRWRLRVDESGVSRRRLLGWEIWPWDAFESGRIRPIEGTVGGYRWHGPRGEGHPWGQDLGFLERSEYELLCQIIRSHWAPPSNPEPPTEVVVRYDGLEPRGDSGPGPLRREVRFAPEGIWLEHRGDRRWFPWHSVRGLWIERVEHGRRDFWRLELTLGDEAVIRLHHGSKPPGRNWSGATAEEIAGILLHHVHPKRLRVTAAYGPPASPEEAEERLKFVERGLGDFGAWRGKYLFKINMALFIIFVVVAMGLALQLSLPAKGGAAPESRGHMVLLMYVMWWWGMLTFARFNAREAGEGLEAERSMLVEWARTPVRAAG